MATQFRLGFLATTAAITGYCWVVYAERQKVPQGRRRRFQPKAIDDLKAETLRTGDVILFDRDPTLYYPLGALHVMAAKAAGGTTFDHAGVVVVRHYEPWILERGHDGYRWRRLDERILCSRASRIVVRKFKTGLTPDQAAGLYAEACRLCGEKADAEASLQSRLVHMAATEAATLRLALGSLAPAASLALCISPAHAFVHDTLAKLGVLSESGTSPLARSSAAWASGIAGSEPIAADRASFRSAGGWSDGALFFRDK